MKRFAKAFLGAAMVAGAAAAVVSPASAAVSFGIGIGPAYYGPSYYGSGYYGPPTAPVCDPYSPYYTPYYCAPAYYGYGYNYAPAINFWGGWGWGDRDWDRDRDRGWHRGDRDDRGFRGDFHGRFHDRH